MKRIIRVIIKNKLTLIGVILVTIMAFVAIFAPWLSPHPPNRMNLGDKYAPPSRLYPMGADTTGRCVLSRVIFGTRISLAVAFAAVFLGLTSGMLVGTWSRYVGGGIDSVVTELANLFLSFPVILLGIMILAIWGSGFVKLTITLALAYFPRFIRLSRGLTASVKENEFVEAARASGRGSVTIMFRHILPNILGELVVAATLWVSAAVLAQASLSFLGLGIPPPTPTWGGLIQRGSDILMLAPWISILPGIAILITVIGFNMIGDGIRDILDPKSGTGL